MEQMDYPYRKLVEGCIAFAKQFLLLPNQFNIYFEDCPSDRFQTMTNTAESNHHGDLWFNKAWFTDEDLWNNRKNDLEFFVFHELRHMHQFCCVERLANSQACPESPETIQKWQRELYGYIRNNGEESRLANLLQEVEIDANAYALTLMNMYHLTDPELILGVIPQEVEDIVIAGAEQYKSRPEVQKYVLNAERKMMLERQGTAEQRNMPVKKANIGRNELCPCGSGLKYKKCKCEKWHG